MCNDAPQQWFVVTGTILDFFLSYVSDRSFPVAIDYSVCIFPVWLTCAVPQGSILGPIHFYISIHGPPLGPSISHFKHISYFCLYETAHTVVIICLWAKLPHCILLIARLPLNHMHMHNHISHAIVFIHAFILEFAAVAINEDKL